MNFKGKHNLIFCAVILSILLQSCLSVGSYKLTRGVKRIKDGSSSDNFTESSANSEKANRQNNGGLTKKTNQRHKCNSISCISLVYLEKRLDHLKMKLLNYYDKRSQDLATSRDGIGFPSLEGALLSLAFLTFAVFLIDLIQQLLSRLRFGVGTGMAPVAVLGRRRKRSSMSPSLRDTDTTTVISSVVSSIENPRFA